MKAYSISGYNRRTGSQYPTFYLLSDVQGIVNAAHAETIAHDIVRDPDAALFAVEVRLHRDVMPEDIIPII